MLTANLLSQGIVDGFDGRWAANVLRLSFYCHREW